MYRDINLAVLPQDGVSEPKLVKRSKLKSMFSTEACNSRETLKHMKNNRMFVFNLNFLLARFGEAPKSQEAVKVL